MIDPRTYSIEHIKELQKKTKSDPQLIERSLHAFGLLEALVTVDTPLIFKGGTCLMILLDSPKRFSTDIDIIVAPETDLQTYLEKASKIIPFKHFEEQTRTSTTGIVKKHFKFFYDSPLTGQEFFIILDSVFETNVYSQIVDTPIDNSFIILNGEPTYVHTPSVDSLLGDKLTAFAPHSSGILINTGKAQEIIKQLFDCANLYETMNSFETVKATYRRVLEKELLYRSSASTFSNVLDDTIGACFSIISKGLLNPEDYKEYLLGIQAVSSHVISQKYNPDYALKQACRVLFLAVSIKHDLPECKLAKKGTMIENPAYSKLNFIRKIDQKSFEYLINAIELL